MRRTANGTRTVMLIAPTGKIFTTRSIRTAPCGPMRSIAGNRIICGRKKNKCRGSRLLTSTANCATGCPSNSRIGFRAMSYATSKAWMYTTSPVYCFTGFGDAFNSACLACSMAEIIPVLIYPTHLKKSNYGRFIGVFACKAI